MYRLSMAAIVAASMGIAGACAAQTEAEDELRIAAVPDPGHHAFAFSIDGHRLSRLDKDGDGRISRDEFMARHAEHFDEFDENEDGYIDDDEIDAFVERKVERVVKRVKLRTERGMEQLEEHLDELGDRLTHRFSEMDGMKFHFRPWRDGFRFRFGGPGGADMIERLDKDGDGALSREEFEARKKDPFDILDRNEDGQLSEDELEAAPGQLMPRPFVYRFGEIEEDDDN